MPSHVYFEYAPPRSWEHFEELCADLFQVMWNDPALVRHGRAGQRQYGIDIVARQGANYPIGLQCKRKEKWPVRRLTAKEIDNEIKEAREFKPPLKAFYLLTTAEEDAKLQAHVRIVNQKHNTEGRFEVVLLGWAELVRRTTLHKVVADKHFGTVGGTAPAPLLGTWFVKDGKLELKGAEFEVSAQELALDLQDWPKGRIEIRQRESDLLMSKINILDVGKKTLEKRTRLIDLRKQLRSKIDLEHALARGVILMLTDPNISKFLLKVWQDEFASTIKAFIEKKLDDNSPFISASNQELHIWPPGIKTLEGRFKEYYPAALYADVFALMQNNRKNWGKPLMDCVGELPPSLRSGHAVPAILQKIQTRLESGVTLDTLKSEQWLDLSSWNVEVY